MFASPRKVKFTEMEYSLPLTNAREAIETALTTIERDRHQVAFPWRSVLPSPTTHCSRRPMAASVYLAAHQTVHGPWESYFGGLEPILIGLGGRPHWGKRHTLTAEQLSERYPEWGTFQDLRARLDPGVRSAADI